MAHSQLYIIHFQGFHLTTFVQHRFHLSIGTLLNIAALTRIYQINFQKAEESRLINAHAKTFVRQSLQAV